MKGILDLYRNRIFILSEYKSWEYLILNSNMFKKQFREYDVDIPKFEEGYYEDLLEQVSQKYRYTGIKHDKHDKLSDCYLKPCCPYSKREKCSVGMKGSDKFIAMLENTKFEDLLLIAGRRSI